MSVFNHVTSFNLKLVGSSAIPIVSNWAAWFDITVLHWVNPPVVLATVQGYPAAVRVETGNVAQGRLWNRQGVVPHNDERFQFQTAPKTAVFWRGFAYIRAFVFLNSELWLQWSIWVPIVSQYVLYIKDTGFEARSSPCHQSAIRSIFVESLRKTPNDCCYCTTTQRIMIRSQNGGWEVKEHWKLHHWRIYHIVTQSHHVYLIGDTVLRLPKYGTRQNTAGWVGFSFWMRKRCCNSSSSVPTWNWYRTADLDLFLTLLGHE